MTVDLATPTVIRPVDQVIAEGWACAFAYVAIRRGFDWPCACGHTSDQCTKRSDGTCDG